jgi:hypothetical protein
VKWIGNLLFLVSDLHDDLLGWLFNRAVKVAGHLSTPQDRKNLRPPKRIIAASELLGQVVREGGKHGQWGGGAGGRHCQEHEVDELEGMGL